MTALCRATALNRSQVAHSKEVARTPCAWYEERLMSEPTGANTQEPVLLSWQMPRWRRRWLFFGVACVLVAVGVGILVGFGESFGYHRSPWADAIGLALSLAPTSIGLKLLYSMVARFECLARYICLTDCRPKQTVLSWEDVVALKRLRGSIIGIDTIRPLTSRSGMDPQDGRRRLTERRYLVGLPKPVLDQLIAILREASNARIIGFD